MKERGLIMADKDHNQSFSQDHKDEEFAAEVAPVRVNPERKEVEPTTSGAVIGYTALALAVLSFFTYPAMFGIIAVILGFFAMSRDARTTGRLAIILGGIAAVLAIVFRVAVISAILSLFYR